jgi:hypothetical protein
VNFAGYLDALWRKSDFWKDAGNFFTARFFGSLFQISFDLITRI